MLRLANAYKQTQFTTTTQSDVLIMLYDGAIRFLEQAKIAIDERKPADKGNLISKALDIIAELDCSLDSSKGGQLADNLRQLYFFCSKTLVMANLKMDKVKIDEVIKILFNLKDAYMTIAKTPEGIKAAEESALKISLNNTQKSNATGNASSGTANHIPTQSTAIRRNNLYTKHQSNFSGSVSSTNTVEPQISSLTNQDNNSLAGNSIIETENSIGSVPLEQKVDANQQNIAELNKENEPIVPNLNIPPASKQSMLYKKFMAQQAQG